MKKIGLYIIVLFFCGACERDLMSYEGQEAIYFAVQYGNSWGTENDWPYMPYTTVEFVNIVGDTTEVNIKVMITGQEKDYPRPFKVIVNQDSTTAREGIDYEALQDEYVVEANNSVAYIPVTLYRQPEMKDETITLGLKLVANDYFSLTFQNFEQLEGHTNGDVVYDSLNATMHTIWINDLLTQPTNWLGSTDASGKEFNVFGVFTEKKFNLICEEFNLTYADFMDSNIMNYTYQMLIGRKMAKLLNEAYHSGNPYLEEDGRLMWVDGCDYTSYPGIPWDGTYE